MSQLTNYTRLLRPMLDFEGEVAMRCEMDMTKQEDEVRDIVVQ